MKIPIKFLFLCIFTIFFSKNTLPQNVNQRFQKGGIFENFTPDKEVLLRRNRLSKTFRNDDGSFTFIGSTGIPYHYKDKNGLWQDIYTDFVTKGDKYICNEVQVPLSFPIVYDSAVGFSSSFNGKILRQWKNYKIVVLNDEGNSTLIAKVSGVSGKYEKNEISYKSILGVEDCFILMPNCLKHNIILHKSLLSEIPETTYLGFQETIELPEGWTLWTFKNYKLGGQITSSMWVDSDIAIVDSEGIVVVSFPQPTAEETIPETHTVSNNKDNKYVQAHIYNNTIGRFYVRIVNNEINIITAIAGSWLHKEGIVYPVVIDPTNNYYPVFGLYWTGYVDYDGGLYTKGGGNILCTWDLGGDPFHGYSMYDVTTIPDNSTVSNADIYLYLYNHGGGSCAKHNTTALVQDPTTATGLQLWTDITTLSDYNTQWCTGPTIAQYYSITLGGSANSDIEDAINGDNRFKVGHEYSDSDPYYSYFRGYNTAGNEPYVAVTYDISTTIIDTCNAIFYDTGGPTGDYQDNEDYIITYCSTNSSCIRSIIEYYNLEFNYDTLFIYDGNTVAGTPIAMLNDTSSYDNLNATGTSYFAQSGCITFHFVSDVSTVKAGWEIRIDCPAHCVAPVCTGSEPANDDCSFSTPICNLNGLCGSTAGTIDHPEINTDPDDSTSLDIFCGIINNNTWLSFVADAPIAVLDVWVYNCGLDLYGNISGIQIQVYETDCSYGNFVAKSNCWSPVEEITGQIIATDLIPGNEYLIMMDGFANSECDFTFAASTGVIVADAGNDKTICEGESTSLTASGGISFLWSASPADASLSGQENNQTINVSPTETTTYTVTVTGDLNPNCPGTADVVVFVNAADASFTGLDTSYCEDDATVYPLTGYPIGGTFNPGNTFNPSVAGVGSHDITYTYEYSVVITFEDDFDPAPLPGWTHGVISGGIGDSWETGNPKGGNGQNFNLSSNPDPVIDHSSNTDNNVYGQGLGSGIGDGVGGHYNSSIEWLKSPAIDCSALSNTTLSFWRSANFEDIYDEARVKISTDDTTWIDLLEPLHPQDQEWVQRIINISDYADGESTVYISWLSYSDISQTYSGWNIDDVTITGVQQGGSCTSVDLQTTTVYPIPTSFFNIVSPPCYNSTAIITYTGSASAGATYIWDFDGGTIISGSGQGPYEISWATSQDYNVSLQVTEYDCISALTTNIVTVPTQLSLTPAHTNSTCGNSDGSASVSVTGGTMPYSYLWTTSGTGSSITSIPSGSYTVTVTDNNGCTESIIINITDEDGPSASITVSFNVSCYDECDGSATVTASGGTEPYTYDWSSGGNQLTENNLCAGIYTVAVTDSNSCIATASVTITEPAELTANITSTDVLCNGGSDGTANLSVSGGTPAYSYSWNYGQTSQDLSNITEGTYDVTVTDANSCTAIASVIINEPDALSLTGEAQDANCDSDDGSATVNITGGTPQYSYIWSDDMNQTTQTATGLSYGDYTVTVTDNNGCIALLIVNVGNQGGGTANIDTFTNILCFGDADGTATVTMTGGTPDFTYIWSTGDTTVTGSTSNTISGLSSAPYYVTITDAKGCIATASVTITEPDELMANITGTDIQCYEGADGAANLTVLGGTPGYSYSWNYGQTSQDLNNLTAGTYEVTVTDANNCFTSASVIIAGQSEIIITYITTPTSCLGNNDGSITLMVDGGISPYQYIWNTEPVQTDSVATQLTEGTYQVAVTDDNSCNAFKEFEVKGSAETCLEIPSAFTPNNDNINDKWEIRHIDLYQKVTIEIYNRWGVIIFEYNGTGAGYRNSQWDGTSKKGKELPFGSYVYIINLHNEIEAINGIVTIIR